MRVFYSFSLTHDGPLVTSLAEALRRRGYEPTIPVDRHIRVHNWRSRLDEIDSIVHDNRDFEIAVADLKPRVFIGHGHASDWKKISEFVSNELGLVVEEYEKESVVGYTVTAWLEQMLATSSLAIIVMSPEDEQKGETLRASECRPRSRTVSGQARVR